VKIVGYYKRHTKSFFFICPHECRWKERYGVPQLQIRLFPLIYFGGCVAAETASKSAEAPGAGSHCQPFKNNKQKYRRHKQVLHLQHTHTHTKKIHMK